MVLSIKSNEADQLARELAGLSGLSITDAVTEALRARLLEVRRSRSGIADQLLKIAEEGRKLRHIDTRSEADILGYDEAGLTR